MKAIPRFSGLIVFGAGIGAERGSYSTASFGGYREGQSVASR
jgi:hypothetical protein